jgi:isoquinoline 1-oxidoreductase alpha subunit
MRYIINQTVYEITESDVPTRLLHLLEKLGLTGAKGCCAAGYCGCCTVIVDGQAVRSCITNAVDVADKAIRTIEGLAIQHADDTIVLHPIQQAFIDWQVPQCGYCIPGQIMSAVALLEHNPHPTENEIKEAMAGNLCRCGMYFRILKAIQSVESDS